MIKNSFFFFFVVEYLESENQRPKTHELGLTLFFIRTWLSLRMYLTPYIFLNLGANLSLNVLIKMVLIKESNFKPVTLQRVKPGLTRFGKGKIKL